MKKIITTLLLLLFLTVINAQNTNRNQFNDFVEKNTYNKWAIELEGGVNKPTRTMSKNYRTVTFNSFTSNLGLRYMFNPKFGVKLDFGYNKMQENEKTKPFESKYIRTNLEAVINLSRVLNFEDWTSRFGWLIHGGFGVSQLTAKNGFIGKDYMGNGILGTTIQIRLSNRIVLTGDLSGMINGKQNWNFDGQNRVSTTAFDGLILNACGGLTFYLGKKARHADWFFGENKNNISDKQYNELQQKIELLEDNLLDNDKDGVANLYDLEPNSIAGVAVNTKGQSIDINQNNIPDELESYIEKTYPKNNKNIIYRDTVEDLISKGYINVFFDFNSVKLLSSSFSNVYFLIKYLKENQDKNLTIIGYADEVGNSNYNFDLSKKRAEAVKKIIVNSGINEHRLNVVAKGEDKDSSVYKNSNEVRQITRKVTFKVD